MVLHHEPVQFISVWDPENEKPMAMLLPAGQAHVPLPVQWSSDLPAFSALFRTKSEARSWNFTFWELAVFHMSNLFHTEKSLHGGAVLLKISFYSLLHFRLFHLHWTYIIQLLFHFITIYDVSLVTCIRVSNSRGQSGFLPRLTGLLSCQIHYAPAAQKGKEDPLL